MVIVKISPYQKNAVTEWCVKHISPRAFYIHTKYGGKGWQFKRQSQSWAWDLEIEDAEKATLIMLKFG
jgi:hypothetical protein